MAPKCLRKRFPKTSRSEKRKNAKSNYLSTFFAGFNVPLGSKRAPEFDKLLAKAHSKKNNAKNYATMTRKKAPKYPPKCSPEPDHFWRNPLLGPFGLQVGPLGAQSVAQEGPKRPRRPPRGAQEAPREPPRGPQETPRRSQKGSKRAQEAAK